MFAADIPPELHAEYRRVERIIGSVNEVDSEWANKKICLVKSAFDRLHTEMMLLPDADRCVRIAALAELLNEVILAFRLNLFTTILDQRFRLAETVTSRNAAEADFATRCSDARALYGLVKNQ